MGLSTPPAFRYPPPRKVGRGHLYRRGIMLSPRLIAIPVVLAALAAPAQEWASLQNLLIKFYGYQRAGAKAGDTRNPFYKTSPYPHAQDNHQGNDLSGGWYDAGDFVKFGLPFGYSA